MKETLNLSAYARWGLLTGILLGSVCLPAQMIEAQNLYNQSRQRFDGRDLQIFRQQQMQQEALMRQNQALRNELEAQRQREAIERESARRAAQPSQPSAPAVDGVTVGLDTIDQSAPVTPQPVDINNVSNQGNPNAGSNGNTIGVTGGKLGESVVTRMRLNAQKPLNEIRKQEVPKVPELQDFSYTATPKIRPRVFEKFDLVTIQIRESHSSTASTSISKDRDREWDTSIDALPNLDLGDILRGNLRRGNLLDGTTSDLELDLTSSRSTDNSGDYSNNTRVTVEVTARVIEVQPNQNLVLEATRTVETGGQTTRIVLTGIARMQDIDANNSILSTRLANLKVRVSHLGELKENNEDGVLSEIMDFVFDF